MKNLARLDLGARLSQASSHHVDYPASSIIDKSTTTPWISTGLYPQCFVISFPDLMQIQSIKMAAKYVKDVLVERSTTERSVANYEEVAEKTLGNSEEQVIEEVLTNEEVTAQHLKFTIKAGFHHFVGVFAVEVMGNLASGRSPSTLIRKPASSSARRYPPSSAADQDHQDSTIEDAEEYDDNNTKRRRRFQSAFKVPTSNRPSHDHTNNPDDSFEQVFGGGTINADANDDESYEEDSRS